MSDDPSPVEQTPGVNIFPGWPALVWPDQTKPVVIERRTIDFPPPTPTRPVRKLRDLVRDEVAYALQVYGQSRKREAAEALGISLKTLYNLGHKHDLLTKYRVRQKKATTG